jgi:hypothetical protein
VRTQVLKRVEEERHILYTIKRRQAIRIGHFLHRNCLTENVIEEKTEKRKGDGKDDE